MTERDIDKFKNKMLREREEIGSEQLKTMEMEFIEMVKQYKIEHPTHTRCVQRWRNWYTTVMNDLHRKPIPPEEYGVLQYHLESFKVQCKFDPLQRLINWVDRMNDEGYYLPDDIKEKVNEKLMQYGYVLKE